MSTLKNENKHFSDEPVKYIPDIKDFNPNNTDNVIPIISEVEYDNNLIDYTKMPNDSSNEENNDYKKLTELQKAYRYLLYLDTRGGDWAKTNAAKINNFYKIAIIMVSNYRENSTNLDDLLKNIEKHKDSISDAYGSTFYNQLLETIDTANTNKTSLELFRDDLIHIRDYPLREDIVLNNINEKLDYAEKRADLPSKKPDALSTNGGGKHTKRIKTKTRRLNRIKTKTRRLKRIKTKTKHTKRTNK